MKEELNCPKCHLSFSIDIAIASHAHYCPYCRSALHPEKASTLFLETTQDNSGATPLSYTSPEAVSFLQELVPDKEAIQFVIGPYQVIKSIGKGGMGEVFLAYDTTCGRQIALKKIRPDLLTHAQLHNRFLKEARITSQLTHPAIIPIYAIHSEEELTYYTMPYVEGKTLKQMIREARHHEKAGEKLDSTNESIPAMIRIFLSVCQAVAYAHSKKVLHRDLKPENIIVGQYGQIVILDWGLAKILIPGQKGAGDEEEESFEEEESHPLHHLTHVGKVVGTVSYMAPERAKGEPATFQTDIYSLGVILYQLLTLKHPFHRTSLKEFRKNLGKEKLIDPIELAPYRDVPKSLSRVVMKCLSFTPDQRYKSVDTLIHDLENYIEGRSEWFQMAELDINKKSDWEFQENVLIAEHAAVARDYDVSSWVNLMISKASFQENIKLEAKVKLGNNGKGIGLLLSIPEAAERSHLNDGYCLWVGSDASRTTKLLRSTVEVMYNPDIFLKRDEWHLIAMEKIDNNIHFYLDGEKQFSYISHLPVAGTHVGLLFRDADFEIQDLFVFVRSQNITVNCLAVPDAFLAHNDYTTALSEYRRIGYSFPGRAEGREAMFRAGITLLEQANIESDPKQQAELYDLALEEFQRLHNTPGAPLEYLGKALVYESLKDYEEEAKCFELAYRRYPRHPLLPILEEQVIYRMYSSSRTHRQATYNFILLTLRFLPKVSGSPNTKKLLIDLEKFWEPLPFLEFDPYTDTSTSLHHYTLILKLSFWLSRPHAIEEMIDDLIATAQPYPITLANSLFALIELGAWKLAENKLNKAQDLFSGDEVTSSYTEHLRIAIMAHSHSVKEACKAFLSLPQGPLDKSSVRTAFHLIDIAQQQGDTQLALLLCNNLKSRSLPPDALLKVNEYTIWCHMQNRDFETASRLLSDYPIELLNQESTLLHFLYGCLLYATEGKEIAHIHFSGVFEVPYPRTWNLFSYYLKGNLFDEQGWYSKSLLWERRQLYRQLALFYTALGEREKALESKARYSQEFTPEEG